MLESDPEFFFSGKKRDEDVGSLALEGADFIFHPVAPVGSGHDRKLRGDAGFNPVRHGSFLGLALVKLAAFAAVEVVNEEANDEPDEEADPGDSRKARHK